MTLALISRASFGRGWRKKRVLRRVERGLRASLNSRRVGPGLQINHASLTSHNLISIFAPCLLAASSGNQHRFRLFHNEIPFGRAYREFLVRPCTVRDAPHFKPQIQKKLGCTPYCVWSRVAVMTANHLATNLAPPLKDLDCHLMSDRSHSNGNALMQQ